MIVLFPFLQQSVDASESNPNFLQQHLKRRILQHQTEEAFVCYGERLCGASIIPQFYRQRNFQPAWLSDEGVLNHSYALISAIQKADQDGLDPYEYHLEKLHQILFDVQRRQLAGMTYDVRELAELDLLMTDAFLLYASHLLAGRIDPESIYSEWVAFMPNPDLAKTLETAIETHRIQETLQGLRPPHRGYKNLKKALKRYRYMAENGGWPVLNFETTLRKEDRGSAVRQLRQRLNFHKEFITQDSGDPNLFDDHLEQAVIRFQGTHGLTTDGIVGPETLAALNIPVKQRIRQIEINLERWRWIPHDLGRRYIWVNVADFNLKLMDHSHSVVNMKIVAGKFYRQTPVFSKKMNYIVLNPYWNVPHTIAVEDILPRIQEDLGYLAERNIKVFDSWNKNAVAIDPAQINWFLLDQDNFPYRLRQEPGPINPLGRIKFMFPNRFAVYLHDTPARGLFEKRSRNFSSGCIRIESPIELATYLLKDNLEWTREKIMEAIESGERITIPVSPPIKVHLLYWTAWTDEQGRIQFREDIYQRDTPLDQALRQKRFTNHRSGSIARSPATSILPARYPHGQNLSGDKNRRHRL